MAMLRSISAILFLSFFVFGNILNMDQRIDLLSHVLVEHKGFFNHHHNDNDQHHSHTKNDQNEHETDVDHTHDLEISLLSQVENFSIFSMKVPEVQYVTNLKKALIIYSESSVYNFTSGVFRPPIS